MGCKLQIWSIIVELSLGETEQSRSSPFYSERCHCDIRRCVADAWCKRTLIFSQQLHEIERIWTPRWRGILGAPLDPPVDCLITYSTANYCIATYLPKELQETAAY